MRDLLHLMQHVERRAIILAALRSGKQLLDIVLRWMPLLKSVMTVLHDEVVAMLKSTQGCTRQLQAICGHSKVRCAASGEAAVLRESSGTVNGLPHAYCLYTAH